MKKEQLYMNTFRGSTQGFICLMNALKCLPVKLNNFLSFHHEVLLYSMTSFACSNEGRGKKPTAIKLTFQFLSKLATDSTLNGYGGLSFCIREVHRLD